MTFARVVVRPRVVADLPACARIASDVHVLDGYPAYLPSRHFAKFLSSPDAIERWVAELDGEVVGHVALHRRTVEAAMVLAAAAFRVPEHELGVVARLLVSPDARRLGVGARLLDQAASEARARSLVPILDVAVMYAPAIALYERLGWERLGTVTFAPPSGEAFSEHVYALRP